MPGTSRNRGPPPPPGQDKDIGAVFLLHPVHHLAVTDIPCHPLGALAHTKVPKLRPPAPADEIHLALPQRPAQVADELNAVVRQPLQGEGGRFTSRKWYWKKMQEKHGIRRALAYRFPPNLRRKKFLSPSQRIALAFLTLLSYNDVIVSDFRHGRKSLVFNFYGGGLPAMR